VLAEDRLAIDALVADRDLVVGHIVVHDHLSRSDHDHLADLLRIEPAHVDAGHHLVRIHDVEEDDVVNPVLDVRHAEPRHGLRFGIAEPVLNDADIVWREIPQRVDVRSDAPEVEALAVDVPHLAELAGVDELADVADGRVVMKVWPTITVSPRASARRASSSTSAVVVASGFSTNTCLPASSARLASA
jgi:hypothetical protein